jgi:hypothetical protein
MIHLNKQIDEKRNKAALIIQKHARRLSAKKQLEMRRLSQIDSAETCEVTFSFDEEQILKRRTAAKEATRKEEITHTVETCIVELLKALKYFVAFAAVIIFGGISFSLIEFENGEKEIAAAKQGLISLKAYFNNNETIIKYLKENAYVLRK